MVLFFLAAPTHLLPVSTGAYLRKNNNNNNTRVSHRIVLKCCTYVVEMCVFGVTSKWKTWWVVVTKCTYDSMLVKLDELYCSICKQKLMSLCVETVRSAADTGTDQREGDWCQVLFFDSHLPERSCIIP